MAEYGGQLPRLKAVVANWTKAHLDPTVAMNLDTWVVHFTKSRAAAEITRWCWPSAVQIKSRMVPGLVADADLVGLFLRHLLDA